MLSLMDLPLLVQKTNGSWENLQIDNLEKMKGIGPDGWEIALQLIIKY
jgi:hypothetical protein